MNGFVLFFKKNSVTAIKSNDNQISQEIAGPFMGDLAMLENLNKEVDNSANESQKLGLIPNHKEDKDSTDSIVFMTFYEKTRMLQRCLECGTFIEDSYDGCVVCGLKNS